MSSSIEIHRHSADHSWTYSLLDQRQRQIAERIRTGGSGALILSELAPVITVGRRTSPSDFLMTAEMLASAGIERIETDRGGFATYHGPGQWVLFPVYRLEQLTGDPRGIRKAVEKLLEIARIVAQTFGVNAEIRSGSELGLWTPRGKLAALGIHVEDGILLHGLSFNVYRTPQSFLGIKPCGLAANVDFLSAQPDFPLFGQVQEALIKTAVRELNLSS